MLVSPRHHAIILKPRDINRITTLIPHAVPLQHRGQQLLAVPHRVPEARMLNNIGIRVPSPIRYYYDWPGRVTPFDAQRATAEFITLNPRVFILNDMGTGKTLSALWATDYLMTRKLIRRVLVAAPLSTLNAPWVETIRGHFLHRRVASLHGSADRRRRLLAEPHDYYVINHDGVAVIADELISREDIDLIIIDEIAVFRNSQTDMYKAMRDVIRSREYVLGMSGGPTPNAPTDAWAQVRLIKPENVTKRFTHFRDQTMIQRSTYKWEARPDALSTVHQAMQPSIRFTRDECVDLPETVYIHREAALTPEQTKAYRELLKQYATEYSGGAITAANEGVKRGKLIQVLCGAVYPDNGGVIHLPCQPRLNVVLESITEAPGKIIVFAPLVGVIELLREYIGKHWEVATVWGEVSKSQRDQIFHDFQHTDRYRVLVAHPKCMAHGLTLTRAATIVWYGPTSPELYEQANARISRPGQTKMQTIVHIEATALERAIYARLKEKLSAQGVLLGMLQETGRQALVH